VGVRRDRAGTTAFPLRAVLVSPDLVPGRPAVRRELTSEARFLPPLTVTGTAVPARVASAGAGQAAATVSLVADVTGAVTPTFRWRQLIARGVPQVRLTGTGKVAELTVPAVKHAVRLHFEVIATDGRFRTLGRTSVVVDPAVAPAASTSTGWDGRPVPAAGARGLRVASMLATGVGAGVGAGPLLGSRPRMTEPRSTGGNLRASALTTYPCLDRRFNFGRDGQPVAGWVMPYLDGTGTLFQPETVTGPVATTFVCPVAPAAALSTDFIVYTVDGVDVSTSSDAPVRALPVWSVGRPLRVAVLFRSGGTISVSYALGTIQPPKPYASTPAAPTVQQVLTAPQPGGAGGQHLLRASGPGWGNAPADDALEALLTVSATSYQWWSCLPLQTLDACRATPTSSRTGTGTGGRDYLPVNADAGRRLWPVASATNSLANGNSTYTSAETAAEATGGTFVGDPYVATDPVVSYLPTAGASPVYVTSSAQTVPATAVLTATAPVVVTAGTPAPTAYRWLRCAAGATSFTGCALIQGATGSSYAVTAADDGSQLAVTATTAVVAGLSAATTRSAGTVESVGLTVTGDVTSSAPPRPGTVVTADVTGTARAGQSVTSTLAHQWLRCTPTCTSIAGATDPSYPLTLADVGTQPTVRVTATSGALTGTAVLVLVSGGTPVLVAPGVPPPTAPAYVDGVISGPGSVVTGVPATYVPQVTVGGRWVRCTGTGATLLDADPATTPAGCVDVTGTPGRGGLDHTVDAADFAAGRLLFVSDGAVTFPGAGTLHDYRIAVTNPVSLAAPAPALLTDPSVAPTTGVRPGSVLSGTAGVWAAFPAVGPHTPVWQRCDLDAPSTCVDLVAGGAPVTGNYPVTPADAGTSLRLRDTVAVAADPTSTATAYSPLVTVAAATLAQLTAPTTGLTGTQAPVVGLLLTGTPGTYSEPGATLAPSWLSCLGPDCDVRASGLTYTPVAADVGRSLVLQVGVSALGATLTARSAGTGLVVSPAAGPEVSTDLVNDVGTVLLGTPLVVRGAAAGNGPFTFAWTRGSGLAGSTSSGPVLTVTAPADGSSGASAFTLTATDGQGRTGSRTITVAYGPGAPPTLLCGLANAVRSLQGFDLGGGIVLQVTSGTVTPGPCTHATTVSLEGSATLFGRLQIASLSASADARALTLSAGQLSFPGDPALSGVVLPLSGSLTVGFPVPGAPAAPRTISGTLTAGDLPLPGVLQLPGAWRAGATLTLGTDGGVPSVALAMVAYDATDGTSTAEDAEGLPVPPEGAPTLSLSGAYGTDGALALRVSTTGLIRFAGSGLDLVGTVDRAAGGPAVVTARGTLAGPVELGRGVTLATAVLDWSGSRFSGSGSLTVLTPGTAVLHGSVAFSFTDPRTWSLAVRGTAADVDLVPGLTLGGATLSGTLSRSAAGTAFGLTVGVTAASLPGISEVQLTALVLGITGTCPAAGAAGPGCAAVLTVAGTVAVTAGASTVRASLTGTVDTAGKTVALRTQTLGAIRLPGGVDIGRTRFSLDYGPAPTTGPVEGRPAAAGARVLRVEVAGDATLNGTPVSALVRFGTAGYLVAFNVGAWTPFPGAPTVSDAGLRLSSYDTTITFGGRTERLRANQLRLFGRVGAPSWFADAVGRDDLQPAYLSGTLVLGGTSADLTARFTFPRVDLVSTGAGDLSLDSVEIRLALQAGAVTVGLSAPTRLLVAAAEGSTEPQALELALTATYAPSSQTLRGELSLTSATGWRDAFGVSGLVVHDLTVAIGIVFGTGIPTPSLGFAGSVELPPGIADPIGLVPGTPVTLVANIDLANPCFAIELGSGASTTAVLDLARLGLVTANSARLVIAPTGCSVGRYRYPAGLTIHFDGSVAAVPVSADLTLTTSPLTVKADIDVGAFALGPLTVDRTHLRLEKVSDGVTVQLEGAVQAFGVTAEVEGEFTLTAGRRVLDVSGRFRTPDLGGFQVNELAVDFHAEGTSVSARASLDLDILGNPQQAEFAFRIANGRFDEARASIRLNAPLQVAGGSLALRGTFDVLLRTGEAPDITFDGSAVADGRTLAAATGRIGPTGLSLSATVDVPGVFSATLAGAVAYRAPGADSAEPLQILDREGTPRDAAPGDFRFAATDVQVSLAGFTAAADVVVGRLGGTTWADLSADLHLGLGEVAGGIQVAGSFSSDGDFALTGSGSAVISGFVLPTVQFAVERSGGELTVEASASARVPGVVDVALSGQLSRTAHYGTLFRLVGSAQLTVGDYPMGSGRFALYRDVAPRNADPGTATAAGTPLAPASCAATCLYRAGLLATATLDVPNLATASVHVALSSDGYAAFSADLVVGGRLASVLGSVTAHVAFSASVRGPATLSFAVGVRDLFGIPGYLLVTGSFSTAGSYSLTAAFAYGPASSSLDLGLVEVGVTASGSFSVSVSGGSGPPTVNVAFAGSGAVRYKPLLGSWQSLVGVSLSGSVDPPTLFVSFTVLGESLTVRV
ncbi:MAG: hypothetical protein JWN57_1343, partial [Frankiales bacterium]|nr:hypothetical protein [Frankiales bacterium]